MNVYATFDEKNEYPVAFDKLERTGKNVCIRGLGLHLAAKATHIRWLHPGCADRIFRAVTSTKQYDRETRTG